MNANLRERRIQATLTASAGISCELQVSRSTYTAYEGDTEITPTDARRVLATAGKVVQRDIVVEAIPQNYGKITWNGSTLSVE